MFVKKIYNIQYTYTYKKCFQFWGWFLVEYFYQNNEEKQKNLGKTLILFKISYKTLQYSSNTFQNITTSLP